MLSPHPGVCSTCFLTEGMLQRFDQLNKWLNLGRPKAYWMTGFFNPQGFLTAMKQEVSRKHAADKWALDDVVMTSEVSKGMCNHGTWQQTEGQYRCTQFICACPHLAHLPNTMLCEPS
jgi:hypothetical protein